MERQWTFDPKVFQLTRLLSAQRPLSLALYNEARFTLKSTGIAALAHLIYVLRLPFEELSGSGNVITEKRCQQKSADVRQLLKCRCALLVAVVKGLAWRAKVSASTFSHNAVRSKSNSKLDL